MQNWKKSVLGFIALVLVFGSLTTGQAAPAKSEAIPAQLPIVVEADKMHFNDASGDLFAQGNVIISQGSDKVSADLINGNSRQNEVWVDGQAHLLRPGLDVTGSDTRYNFGNRTGTMQKVTGTADKKYIAGTDIELLPNEMIIENGTVTGCPAKIPDYHISAARVEIWPGDKLIAYEAKFWIKDKVIFTLPKYSTSLRQSAAAETSPFPRAGYFSEDGVYIRQHLEYPLGDKVAAFTDLDYYTKTGFKPAIGLIDREKNYDLKLLKGDFRDSNAHWIKKESEFELAMHPQQVASLPIHYTFSAASGWWKDETKASWHQEYNLYLTGDPVKISDSMQLNLGTGYNMILESYDNSLKKGLLFDSTLTKEWSPRLQTWLGYHYRQDNETLFAYSRPDMMRELDVGFKYKLDKLNALTFNQSYDVENKRIYDQDYTWSHSLHCWEASLTYRAKRGQVLLHLGTIKW